MHPKELKMVARTETRTPMSTATPLNHQRAEQPRCPQTGELIRCGHAHSGILLSPEKDRRSDTGCYEAEPENTLLSEREPVTNGREPCDPCAGTFGTGESTETAQTWLPGPRRGAGSDAKGCGVSFSGGEMVWIWADVIVTQLVNVLSAAEVPTFKWLKP